MLDRAGQPLLDTLVHPQVAIEPEATTLHGITQEMVRDAPSFGQVWPRLRELLCGRTVVVYNADFDRWRLIDSARAAGYGVFAEAMAFAGPRGVPADRSDGLPTWKCAMLLYAEYHGAWNDYMAISSGNRSKWRRLSAGSRFRRGSTAHAWTRNRAVRASWR